jgi:hypothetical protein
MDILAPCRSAVLHAALLLSPHHVYLLLSPLHLLCMTHRTGLWPYAGRMATTPVGINSQKCYFAANICRSKSSEAHRSL